MLSLLLTASAGAQVESRSFSLAGRRVAAWWPRGETRPLPVVLFSHGYGGVNVQSGSLMRALAASGYLVLAPNHRDAAVWAGGQGKTGAGPGFGAPGRWTQATFRDRAEDLAAIYRAAQEEPALSDRLQPGPVVLAGHSLGGYTALGLAGGWPEWAELGLEPAAVLALSPYTAPYLHQGTLAGLRAPVMYQGGTRDSGLTPSAARAFTVSPHPKVFVSFQDAGHLAWTAMDSRHHDLIERYAVAFLNFLRSGEPAALLSTPAPGVARLESAL